MNMLKKDIVIGLDSFTQSTKAIAWTCEGENVKGVQIFPCKHPKQVVLSKLSSKYIFLLMGVYDFVLFEVLHSMKNVLTSNKSEM